MHYLFEPGLFSSGPVRTALLVGAVVAITSGVIGVFTVIRGQSFAGHALADVASPAARARSWSASTSSGASSSPGSWPPR